MRKQNSAFQTAFVSEAGSKLKNNDYFGFVELDEYACYVIADGITDLPSADSARLAIETVILYFQESPSMSRRTIRRLIHKANEALIDRESYKRSEASLTVVLTNYQSIRYGYLGNTRLRMYRGGRVYRQTEDMSFSQELAEQDKIARDALQRHEERNNLYSYLGLRGAKPYISKKIKLLDTDIIALYTRGIWENIDEAELDEVFSEADNKVRNSLDNIEDMLLSRQPENLDNYTFAAIFVDKVYADPQRAKKRKKIIIISIVVLLVIVIAVCVCCFLIQRRKRQIADMNYYFTNTVEYINTGNFIRAQEECGKSEVLAEKLRDNDMRDKLQEYLFVIETAILADENYSKGEYEAARNYYINAMDRARYADRIGESYMEQKLEKIEDFLSVMDFITLGDSLLENAEYEKAEEKYLQAKKLASAAHYTEGKEKAMEALEKLYAEWSEAEEQKKQAASEQAEKETAAAELIASGDRACLEQDFAGAKVYYTMAMIKYQELEDAANQEYVQQKINSVDSKIAERDEKMERAASLEQQGAQAWSWGDYWSAESLYLQAKGLYLELGNTTDVERIANVVAQIDALIEQSQDVDG